MTCFFSCIISVLTLCVRDLFTYIFWKVAFLKVISWGSIINEGKEASVAYFNNWVEEVKRTVPKEKLLVFNVKEGWEPLCEFLKVPIPDIPFPNTNDSAQMKKYQNKSKESGQMFMKSHILLEVQLIIV